MQKIQQNESTNCWTGTTLCREAQARIVRKIQYLPCKPVNKFNIYQIQSFPIACKRNNVKNICIYLILGRLILSFKIRLDQMI